GGELLGSVAQLGELARQLLPPTADLVEGRPQRAAGCAQRSGQRDRGVLRVGELLADLRRELMPAKLILDAAQVVRQGILSRGKLIDDQLKRIRGAILRRGDRADLIVGLL